MIVLCPAAPTVRGDLDVALAELKSGSELVRFHSPAYQGNAFNPNTGRKMEDAAAGARFSPFPDPRGVNVPTTYAGSTQLASALESVFHDVPHIPSPSYPVSKLSHFVLSRLRVRRALKILELVNPQLRQSRRWPRLPRREARLRLSGVTSRSRLTSIGSAYWLGAWSRQRTR